MLESDLHAFVVLLVRMKILLKIPILFVCLIIFNFPVSIEAADVERPNILFIAIDDMNDWVGYLGGHPQAKTPSMDKLAAQGVVFTEAHCAAPACGPSRAAIMSGRWPSTTSVYSNNAHFPSRFPDIESLPEFLQRTGYMTLGAGKLFHGGESGYPEGSFDDYAKPAKGPFSSEQLNLRYQNPSYTFKQDGKTFTLPLNGMPADRPWQSAHTFDWGPVDLPDDSFRDTQHVNWIIEQLGEDFDRPFFMGIGFNLPHQPLYAPKRFHDMYPPEKVVLPPYLKSDLDDLSRTGRDYALIPTTSGTHATVVRYGQWRNAVSSYLATITFVDHLIGRLLKAFDESSHADNTWIILWSDHGWHLGEKDHWGKATGWYRSSRVPLMIVPPSTNAPMGFKAGSVSHRPVNLIDLYPTINDIAGVPIKPELEGKSLLPLVRNPEAPWDDHTITTFASGNHAITTNRWRYIQYFDGSAELYDRQNDPNEWENLIHKNEHTTVIEKLKQHVPEEPQWKHFIRYNNFKAVVASDGSPMLIFNYDVENHLEERFDESGEYPETVAYIQNWLNRNKPYEKRINISTDR